MLQKSCIILLLHKCTKNNKYLFKQMSSLQETEQYGVTK